MEYFKLQLPVPPSSLEGFVALAKEAASIYRKQHKRTAIIAILLFHIMSIDCLFKNCFGLRCVGEINNEVAKLNY